MPQLNVIPWFMIFISSWAILLALTPIKFTSKIPPSPMMRPLQTSKSPWTWPWT